jgi:hypothetical protein
VVKNQIKRFSQASTATPKPIASTASSLSAPSLTSLPNHSSPSLSLSSTTSSSSSSSSALLDLKATWDFTSGRSILEVQPIDLDGEELPLVDGFTLEQTREYFAKYPFKKIKNMPERKTKNKKKHAT